MMEQGWKEKLNIAKENLVYIDELSDEECEQRFWKAHGLVDELIKTKDSEVLECLLEFFNEENEEYGGFCEHLKSQIGANFTLDQLLNALYKKFDYLIENDVSKLVQFSFWFFSSNMFESFRNMFNQIHSVNSEKYLNELDDWSENDYIIERKILREDMKKW